VAVIYGCGWLPFCMGCPYEGMLLVEAGRTAVSPLGWKGRITYIRVRLAHCWQNPLEVALDAQVAPVESANGRILAPAASTWSFNPQHVAGSRLKIRFRGNRSNLPAGQQRVAARLSGFAAA